MAKKTIRPLYDRVLIERIDEEEKTAGGIIIPDSAKEKPLEGRVVAVGQGRVRKDGTLQPVSGNVDDRVLFSKYAETEVKIGTHAYLLLREDDLLGVIS